MTFISRGAIEIRGLANIEKRLKDYPSKVRAKIIRTAVKKSAQVVGTRIRANAPSDTGLLKNSIKVRTYKPAHWGIKAVVQVKPGIKRRLANRTKGLRGRNSYAAFVEYGTKNQAPRAFGRAGFEASKSQALQTMIREFRENFAKAIR